MKPKRPRDTNQLAKLIVDIAIGSKIAPENKPNNKNKMNVELGRIGGLKGGKARAENLTKEQRSQIAQKAALKRWGK